MKNGTYKDFHISKEKEEYIAVYATPVKGELLFEIITNEEYKNGISEIKNMSEVNYESLIDETATINTTIGVKKIRHLSTGIGNSLKILYGYRCQICGKFFFMGLALSEAQKKFVPFQKSKRDMSFL